MLESPSFRWRHKSPPHDGGSARAAYDELVGRLASAGWTRRADGADWFATVFTCPAGSYEEIGPRLQAEVVPAQLPPVAFVAPPIEASHDAAEVVPAHAQHVAFVASPLAPAHEPAADDVPAVPEPGAAERPPEQVIHRRRSRVALGAGAALAAAALASTILLRGQDGTAKIAGVRRPAPAHALGVQSPSAAMARVTKVVAALPAQTRAPAKASLVDVRVTAHGNGSWVEFRRTSPTGAVLYSATLADHQTLHFRAPKLWARFGAAANLTITANGHPVRLEGTYEKLFVPQR